MDKFERRKIARPLAENTLSKCYNWLVNHVPEAGKNQQTIFTIIIRNDFQNSFLS